MQSTGKVDTGVKLLHATKGYISVAVFPSKEDARDYLKYLIQIIKKGQKMGTRTKRNLDPNYKGGLDFLILPCKVEIEDDQMIKRGWKL